METKKPCLTLIIGLPGVGKSTVAQLITENRKATIINSDEVRRELFPKSRTYSPKETQLVIKETEKRVKELLKKGEDVILDALFTKQGPRDFYKNLAVVLGANFRVIFVSADEGIVEERMRAREKTNNPSEATFSYYLDRKNHFIPVVGEHIVVNNSDDILKLKEKVIEIR